MGESGSGKSVTSLICYAVWCQTLRIALQMVKLHFIEKMAQSLIWLNFLKKKCAYRGNELAMIFQEPMTSLNPVFTCGDRVMEAIMLHQNISKSDAKELTIKLFERGSIARP